MIPTTRPGLDRRPLRLERLEERDLLSISGATLDNLAVDTTQFDNSEIIVALRPGTNPAALSAVNPAIVRTGAVESLGNGLFSVGLNSGVNVGWALTYFQSLSYVRYAQPDYTVSLTRLPNDPSFGSQYGLHNTGQSGGNSNADIDAPDAWDVTTGTRRTIVAIIDTGVDYTHPDLAANIWRNTREIAGNGIDDDRNGFVDDTRGWDFANNDNDPMDDNGHGTHVAGIIGAVGNNGIGISGINWNVQIMPLKFLGANGSGSLSNAIRCLNYAVANGASVSNNSYGGGGYYQAFADAISAARAAGHIFVAAAGNNSVNTNSQPAYPASYNFDNIISVAATDRNDNLASFSNYGSTSVDIGAPGVSIYSTLRNGSYGSMSGTSMAAPMVTGAVSLLRDLHPNWTYRQIIDHLYSTADPISSLAGRTSTGRRLNIGRAIRNGAVVTPTPSDTRGATVTSAAFAGTSANSFNRVRVTFSEAISASTFTAADIVGLTRNGAAITGLAFTVTPVSGSTTQFDIGFATQSTAGTYALTFGPDIRDLAGNQMNQNGNAANGELADRYTATATLAVSTNRTFYSRDLPKAILDQNRTTSVLTIDQDISIDRLGVKVNLNHTYDGDLRITLKGPNGQQIVLFNRRGGSGDNINTVFDDRASLSVSQGAAPFLGWHRPEQALSAFAGQNARGTWTLIVDDLAARDTGTLNSWSITVESGGGTGASRSLGTGPEMAGASFVGWNTPVLGATLDSLPVATTRLTRHETVPIVPISAPQQATVESASAATLSAPSPGNANTVVSSIFLDWLED